MQSQKAEVRRQKGWPKAGEVKNAKAKGKSKKAKGVAAGRGGRKCKVKRQK
jgi:hypothetical protein